MYFLVLISVIMDLYYHLSCNKAFLHHNVHLRLSNFQKEYLGSKRLGLLGLYQVLEALKNKPLPNAIFTCNDIMGVGALRAIEDAG